MNGLKRKKHDPLALPPRWVKCPRKGTLVADLFLPFKTPLDHKFNIVLDGSNQFPPESILDYGIKFGLWVDLTKTTRFYNSDLVKGYGVEYYKLECEGHNEAPNTEIVEDFLTKVQEVTERDPDAKIAVHCTHGFNRTGFLICCYLIEFGYEVDSAIDEFAKCRPPGIYKQEYLQELCSRYNFEKCPQAPPLPEWDNEQAEEVEKPQPVVIQSPPVATTSCVEEPDKQFAQPANKRPRREVEKHNAQFCEGIETVLQVTDRAKLAQVRSKVQEMCEWNVGGFPGLQPVSLDMNNLRLMTEHHFRVSWKSDGTRYMLLIDGEEEIYFLDRDNTVFHAPQFKFPHRKDPSVHLTNTLLDGELVIDKVCEVNVERDVHRFLAYDIVVFSGHKVGKELNYDLRLQCIDKEIIQPRAKAIFDKKIDKAEEPFSIRCKPFYDITKTEKLLNKSNFQVSHELDGLVFQKFHSPYRGGSNADVLKWKPPHLNSIDFKLSVTTQKMDGCPPQVLFLLYVNGEPNPFSMMEREKKLMEHDGKIVECSFIPEDQRKSPNEQWKFLRVRTDKSSPNHITTARAVFASILTPITKEYLLQYMSNCAKKPKV